MLDSCEPKTYQQWMVCFENLSNNLISDEYVSGLRQGSCPGIERVMPQFLDRIQDTVNRMINRYTKSCTASLKGFLEEGDFSNIEIVLYRFFREMKRCRFYLNILFIPEDFVRELDKKTVSEINRYWLGLRRTLEEIADESGNECVYDTICYIKRLMNKDKSNG